MGPHRVGVGVRRWYGDAVTMSAWGRSEGDGVAVEVQRHVVRGKDEGGARHRDVLDEAVAGSRLIEVIRSRTHRGGVQIHGGVRGGRGEQQRSKNGNRPHHGPTPRGKGPASVIGRPAAPGEPRGSSASPSGAHPAGAVPPPPEAAPGPAR